MSVVKARLEFIENMVTFIDLKELLGNNFFQGFWRLMVVSK